MTKIYIAVDESTDTVTVTEDKRLLPPVATSVHHVHSQAEAEREINIYQAIGYDVEIEE